MAPKPKRRWFIATTIIFCTLIGLAGAETVLRKWSPTYRRMHGPPHDFFIKHPTRGYALKPGYDNTANWGYRFRVNSLGFRGPEVNREKKPGIYRILILGDSIAMGAGLDESDLMSAELSRLAPAWEVINTGVGGYDIEEEAQFLQEEGLGLAPDAVVLVACLNDWPGLDFSDLINPLRDLPVPCKNRLLHHSALAVTAQDLYERIGMKSGGPPDFLAASQSSGTMERIEKGWSDYTKYLDAMARECRSRDITFIVLLVPHAAQFEDPEKRFLPQKRLQRTRGEGILFADPAPEFADQAKPPYILPDPVHPNPDGHRIMARLIYQELTFKPVSGEAHVNK